MSLLDKNALKVNFSAFLSCKSTDRPGNFGAARLSFPARHINADSPGNLAAPRLDFPAALFFIFSNYKKRMEIGRITEGVSNALY